MRVIWLPLLSAPLLAVGLGCSKAPPSGGSGSSAISSAAAAPSAPAQPQRVTGGEPSSASAFELVARAGGLRLLWAGAQLEPDWLFELELTQAGRAQGEAHRLRLPARSLGKVVDLGAVAFGEQLALAWLEQAPAEARAQASVLGATPPTLLDLGPAALVSEAARGNIAVAAEPERGRALVMWRGLEAPCVDRQSAPCTGFTFRRIRPDGAETTGLPLSVPVPCASHSVELATTSGRFHYGVCTREGSDPVTTMFSIQYDPEYARAEPLLKGCLPLGTLEVAGDPWLLGDCHGKRRAARVPVGDEKVQVENIEAPSITCTPQRAELRQGRFVLQLREPRAGLEAVLPAELVPTGARAGWTGTHLVVAYVAGKQLETRAFGCREGNLQPM